MDEPTGRDSLWIELLVWTLFVAGSTFTLLWRSYGSLEFIFAVILLPFVVLVWAIGWGLIVIAGSSPRPGSARGRRCPACSEPVTAEQEACSWCGRHLTEARPSNEVPGRP